MVRGSKWRPRLKDWGQSLFSENTYRRAIALELIQSLRFFLDFPEIGDDARRTVGSIRVANNPDRQCNKNLPHVTCAFEAAHPTPRHFHR